MRRYISISNLLACSLLLVMAIGCSDASAAEGTYLPVHEPCPSNFDANDRPLPASQLENAGERDSDVPLEEDSDSSNTDLDEFLQRRPWTGATPSSYTTPQFVPASTGFDVDATDAESSEFDDASASPADSEAIDINSADVDELTELSGIGPALAERIVEYRQQRDFANTAQLQRVDGIGPATYDDIASEITAE